MTDKKKPIAKFLGPPTFPTRQNLINTGISSNVMGMPQKFRYEDGTNKFSQGRKIFLKAPICSSNINGPNQTVVSGDQSAVLQLCQRLSAEGIVSKPLTVSHAFHSARMDPMLAVFEAQAARLHYQPCAIPLVSNLTGGILPADAMNGQYFRDHVRCPVNFLGGMQTLFALGCQGFLEIGPHPVLVGMGRRCLPKSTKDNLLWLPSVRRGKQAQPVIQKSFDALQCNGYVR